MKKYVKAIAMVALMAVVCLITATAAQAAGEQLFQTAQSTLIGVFKNVRVIVFVMGGFALVGFAIAAIFGKLDWKKVAILAIGLALLAVASQVVDYAVKAGQGNGSVGSGATWGSGEGMAGIDS